MTEHDQTTEWTGTALPGSTRRADLIERARPSETPWLWIVWTPFLLLAAPLAAWGGVLLFGSSIPPWLPALPAGLGGIDLVGAALFLAVAPYGFYAAWEDSRERRLQAEFPDLLTDLSANRKAGFTLAETVRLAAESDYGPLNPYIDRMCAQLSWNVPFEEALQRFADRVGTPLVTRSVTLVLEAERTGGHITDVLQAAARDAREIEHLERKRHIEMRTYTMVMYVVFLVFLGVVAVLQTQLLPQLLSAAGATGAQTGAGGALSGLATTEITLEAYRTFFYTASLVQAIGSGAMAGVMARGKVRPGLVHAAVMVLVAIVTFSVLLV